MYDYSPLLQYKETQWLEKNQNLPFHTFIPAFEWNSCSPALTAEECLLLGHEARISFCSIDLFLLPLATLSQSRKLCRTVTASQRVSHHSVIFLIWSPPPLWHGRKFNKHVPFLATTALLRFSNVMQHHIYRIGNQHYESQRHRRIFPTCLCVACISPHSSNNDLQVEHSTTATSYQDVLRLPKQLPKIWPRLCVFYSRIVS